AHEQPEALLELVPHVFLRGERRGAVAVLTVAGREADQPELVHVAADGRLRDLDAALREVVGDLGLGGDELLLHQLLDQPLTVLFARHTYAVYGFSRPVCSEGRPATARQRDAPAGLALASLRRLRGRPLLQHLRAPRLAAAA